jgi:SAM-dependent methyltransferase
LLRRRYKATMPRSHRRVAPFTARTADRHVLYQEAVQAPERDARFLSRYFLKTTGAPLRRFREDFCGTALLSCWFVKLHRDNRALGVDLHWPTLAWGRIRNLRTLLDADQRQRLTLRQADVRAVRRPAVQAIAALNFSYSVFQTRSALRDYVANAFAALEPGGMLFVDAWGGPDVLEEKTDRTRNHGFDYLWEQRAYDPISHRIECAIHFVFRDGTRMRNAFVYDWRLWTLAELRELFAEVGFLDVHVLWEGTDQRTSQGNGVFRRKEVGDNDPAWITYVVGRKPGGRSGRARR